MPISSLVFHTAANAKNAAPQQTANMICQATVSWPGCSGCANPAVARGDGASKARATEGSVSGGAGNGGAESGGGSGPPGFGSLEASDTGRRVGAAGPTSPSATLRHR